MNGWWWAFRVLDVPALYPSGQPFRPSFFFISTWAGKAWETSQVFYLIGPSFSVLHKTTIQVLHNNVFRFILAQTQIDRFCKLINGWRTGYIGSVSSSRRVSTQPIFPALKSSQKRNRLGVGGWKNGLCWIASWWIHWPIHRAIKVSF